MTLEHGLLRDPADGHSPRMPEAPRCLCCAKPMKLFRRTQRFGTLPDLYFFNCVSCDEWQFEEGDPIVAASAPGTHSA
jgi:hypothetical protein